MIDVVDFAHQIIRMDGYIEKLERENEELRNYKKLYFELTESSIESSKELMGICLTACLDPESSINQMHKKAIQFDLSQKDG